MSRLVIHIGTHKTATTRLQKLFRRNRDLLERHGLIFPQIGVEDGQHALVGVWNGLVLPEPGFDARAAWAGLAARHAQGGQTVFLSSEEFSRMNARRVDMAELAALTAPFGEVRLICTLRNQASFLQSVYQQISGSRPPADWDAFFARMIEIRMADGLTLDYNRFYSHLLTGFPRRAITLISYDHAIREPGGLIGAWLRVLGLPLRPADLVPVHDDEANISPEPLATLAACRLTRPAPPPRALVQLAGQALEQCFGPGRPSSLLTRAELARMEAVFGPMNAALSHRVDLLQPGFAVGPMLGVEAETDTPGTAAGAGPGTAAGTGRSPLVFREDLTAGFWIEISRRLEGLAA